jgi:4-hydroxythreonine-4-phosphate dehydrogenase
LSTGSTLPSRKIRLALTLGDPRGIGPEIVASVLANPDLRHRCDFVVVGPGGAGVNVDEKIADWPPQPGCVLVAEAGRASGLAIKRAVELAASGDVEGLVTAPIDKFALRAGGFDFPGHTEMLAQLTGRETVMMLASDKLRVALATTHIPLRDVPAALSRQLIVRTAEITREGLAGFFGITDPVIALCALNPHAGDGGRFGNEDDDLLAPAARECGILGPFPADTVFVRAMRGEFHAVIAPYHDVGMTAIKVASFGSAVNVTLGLPFPRCSPDHGTALDIAGKGIADASSMVAAVRMCADISTRLRSSPRS